MTVKIKVIKKFNTLETAKEMIPWFIGANIGYPIGALLRSHFSLFDWLIYDCLFTLGWFSAAVIINLLGNIWRNRKNNMNSNKFTGYSGLLEPSEKAKVTV